MPGSLKAAFALLLAALVAVVVVSSGDGGDDAGGGVFGPALADPIPYDGRSPALPVQQEGRERVLAELPRPALAERDDVRDMTPRAQRAYVASLKDETAALLSALEARGVRTSDVVSYERVWHGFAATIDASDLPGLQSLGVQLRPLRRFFPALAEPVGRAAAGSPGGGGSPLGHDGDGAARAARVAVLAGPAALGPLRALLSAAGVRSRALRTGATRRSAAQAAPEEHARTDELLRGLERAVDPDGDGATDDRDRVALIGDSAPYAGFADAPEALAVQGAERLGTLVVAPGGQEGPGTAAYGTVGSPAGAAAALAVAPRSDVGAVARATLVAGPVTARGAAVLARGLPAGGLRTSAPVASDDPARLIGRGAPALAGRIAVVRAGANPAAQAAAAAAVGARAVLLAQPRAGRPLPAMPAGRVSVPVVGVTGAAARAVLALKAGTPLRASDFAVPSALAPGGRHDVSPFASRGPSFAGAAKPELARAGSALAAGRIVSGAAVAAAAVAAEAARLGAASPAALRTRLLAGADTDTDADADAAPARPAAAPRIAISRPSVTRRRGRTGVEFTVGTFERGDAAAGESTTIVPAARLELTLRDGDGRLIERLTPDGGERGVLPGRYAYTLPSSVAGALAAGRYAFRVQARAPRARRATSVTSEEFAVR